MTHRLPVHPELNFADFFRRYNIPPEDLPILRGYAAEALEKDPHLCGEALARAVELRVVVDYGGMTIARFNLLPCSNCKNCRKKVGRGS